MLCMQCGTTNDDDAQACVYCGAPLASPQDAQEPEAAHDVNDGTDESVASPSEDTPAQSIWGKEISGLWAEAVGKEPFGEAEVEAAAQALIEAQGRFRFLEDGASNSETNSPDEDAEAEEAPTFEDVEAEKAEDAESEEPQDVEPEDAESEEPQDAEPAEAAEATAEEVTEPEVAEAEEGAEPEGDAIETVEVAEEGEDDLEPTTGERPEDSESAANEEGGETVEAAPPEPSVPVQRYCLRCGQPVEDGVDTCPNCGAPSDEFIVNSAAEVGFVRAGTRHSSYEEDFDIFDRYSSKQLAIVALVVTAMVMAIVGGLASMVGDLSFFKGGNGGLDPIAQEGGSEDEQAEEGEPAEEEPAQEEEPAPIVEAVAPANGLTPLGNLTNGGYVVEHDGWVYYAIPEGKGGWNTTAIGRMREDGSQQSLIYSTSGSDTLVWHLNVMDDRLYFSQDSGSWSANLMSVGLNGSDSRTEGTTKPGTLCQTYEGRVYSSDWSGLWSFDPTWVEGWNCYGGPATDALWRVWGSPSDREQGSLTVYYFYQGGSTVSATSNLWEDIWGHDIVWLEAGRSLLNVQPTDGGLWLLVDTNADGLGDEVMHAELDGSGLATYAQTSGPATRLNAGAYGVFVVVQEGSAMRIERIDAPAAQPAEAEEGEEASAGSAAEPTVTVYYRSDAGVEIAYPSVYGKYLYFGLVSGDSSHLMRMELAHPGQKPEEIV